ncbi:SpoIID/LytB domain-containing protein [Bacteroides stercorirosoris]|uniref:SpoIID/LytB domain-containing protein n=1 Tax=Bacteroides stercorirosoris TaxID=871324 RepID=A0A413HAZ1_9BACE|nr:SpoIID/LytB domain-containing protein [Bacteroides stercorirosoris]RGX80873.1 SpoIID/LytB domain-containing protein [Bacteroides stercorirosoris]
MKEPKVHVGILFEPQIEFVLLNPYQITGTYCDGVVTHHTVVSGKQVATYNEGKILWYGRLYDELLFEPIDEATDSFELLDVTIGINFHWERKEDQRFLGALKIITENNKLTAINVIHVEDYLTSVISSEMSATASLELLKAHAVISRSWLLAIDNSRLTIDNSQLTIDNSMQHASAASNSAAKPSAANCQLSIVNCQLKWYERDAHTRFDVCADDHCQRYQGITRASTEIVKQAIAATRGQVLMYGGKICDARFSKCCGGAFEEFQYCWEDAPHPYLRKQRDFRIFNPKTCDLSFGATQPGSGLPDLTDEQEATTWIRTSPPAFCNTTDKGILSQVLNNYDQETTDFYRWKVEYTQDELSALILKRSGIDYGQIIDLVPIARGTSGRLWKLKIVGTKRTLIIGKELEIRRTLSASHLYSSAFVVDKEDISPEGIPGRFILTGAGWGHGVGLCQIGAAVMGEQGYKYDAILLHYYIGASLDQLYD